MKHLLRSRNTDDSRRCSFLRFFRFLRIFWALPIFCVFSISTKERSRTKPVASSEKKNNYGLPFFFIERHCQQLYAPPHGSLEPCSNLPEQTCEFSCNKGYILTGSTTRTCNSNGTWTGTLTQCNGNWSQLLFPSSIMILGEGLWGWGCILKGTRHVSPCYQLQFLYFKCSILIASKKSMSAFRFLVLPSLIL